MENSTYPLGPKSSWVWVLVMYFPKNVGLVIELYSSKEAAEERAQQRSPSWWNITAQNVFDSVAKGVQT